MKNSISEKYVNRAMTPSYREYKFRGKTLFDASTKSEWIFGVYVFHSGYDHIVRYENGDMKERVVDRDSVGEWTGLKDKNGLEIYEGDVIRLDAADEDEYRNGSPYVMFEKGCFAYRYSHWSDDLCIVLYQTANQMLVVGNIYENPELIAKESDDPPHDGKTSEG